MFLFFWFAALPSWRTTEGRYRIVIDRSAGDQTLVGDAQLSELLLGS